VSFNFNTKSWISFHSYLPNWYIGENNFFYSGINGCCDDIDVLVGTIGPIPTTTTTSSTSSTSTTTTTTTTIDCNLSGTVVETDCTLSATAVAIAQVGCFDTISFDLTTVDTPISYTNCCGETVNTGVPAGVTQTSRANPNEWFLAGSVLGALTNVTYQNSQVPICTTTTTSSSTTTSTSSTTTTSTTSTSSTTTTTTTVLPECALSGEAEETSGSTTTTTTVVI
jgi:hypothetical protein